MLRAMTLLYLRDSRRKMRLPVYYTASTVSHIYKGSAPKYSQYGPGVAQIITLVRSRPEYCRECV